MDTKGRGGLQKAGASPAATSEANRRPINVAAGLAPAFAFKAPAFAFKAPAFTFKAPSLHIGRCLTIRDSLGIVASVQQ